MHVCEGDYQRAFLAPFSLVFFNPFSLGLVGFSLFLAFSAFFVFSCYLFYLYVGGGAVGLKVQLTDFL